MNLKVSFIFDHYHIVVSFPWTFKLDSVTKKFKIIFLMLKQCWSDVTAKPLWAQGHFGQSFLLLYVAMKATLRLNSAVYTSIY